MANNEKNKKKKNKKIEEKGTNKKEVKNTTKKETEKSSKQTANKKENKKKVENKQSNNKKNKPSKESVAAEKQINKISSNNEVVKLIKIVAIVTAIMVVFYLITLVATNKADEVNKENEKSETQKEKTEIQYDYIMIGAMLNKEGTYYVLIEEDGDNRLSEYDTLIQTISANEDAPSVYKANLTDSFNQGYLSKEANYDVDDISDFRVTGTTLVKISDNSIAEVFDTYDTIKNKLTELSE